MAYDVSWGNLHLLLLPLLLLLISLEETGVSQVWLFVDDQVQSDVRLVSVLPR